jgi:hypothetical protein
MRGHITGLEGAGIGVFTCGVTSIDTMHHQDLGVKRNTSAASSFGRHLWNLNRLCLAVLEPMVEVKW